MRFPWLLAVPGMALVGICGATGDAGAQTRYSIATGTPTSGNYRLFSPAAEYINKTSKKLRFTPLSTDGSLENCRRVASGQVKFGMCTTQDLPKAWKGEAPFDKPQRDLRVVGPDLAPILIYFMVRKDSGVATLQDLAGKEFGCGGPGASVTQICKDVLKEFGLLEKVGVVELPFDQLGDMVANRDIVGMARGMIELPAGFAQELNTRTPLRILDLAALANDQAKRKGLPALVPTVVPAGTYQWQPEQIQLVSMRSYTIVHASVPDDDVYEFTKLVHSQGMIDHMENAYKGHSFFPRNKDPLDGLPIKLHPGAERFWREVGVTIHPPTLGE